MSNAMKQAFKSASQAKPEYTPTLHAIERVEQRLGVAATEAAKWLNDVMKTASLLFKQTTERGVRQGVYEIEGARLIVDLTSNTIVTVLPQADSSFLRPIFERERRKLHREITRNSRQLELLQAKIRVKHAEASVNKARARNPQTRELIDKRMGEFQAMIERYEMQILREQERMGNFEKVAGAFV